MEKNSENSIEAGISQIVVWVILLILIFIRILDNAFLPKSWIWIINYIGMAIAFLNLFIEKCNKMRKKSHRKYKPFLGLTIIISILVCLFGVVVGKLQTTVYAECLNDVITLLSVFFSSSKNIWNSILKLIVKYLRG